MRRLELRCFVGVADMKALTIVLHGRKLILLTGACNDKTASKTVEIEAREQLVVAARRDPDAVAFGYTSGKWVAGA